MRIAVAGGSGFLGSHVVKILKEKGHDVIPFSRRTGTDIRVLGQINHFLASTNPEVVVNCAANVGGIAYNALYPVEVYEDNLLIDFNLVKACYSNNLRKLVNVMGNCTYPGIAEIYREDEWWKGEMHETVLVYGVPRKMSWAHCWAYKIKNGFNSIHIVLPNLYGPGDHFDAVHSHALGALVAKIVEAKRKHNSTVEIWGTGYPVREWGYVEDAAGGITIAMEKYDDIQILNIGEGKGYTIREIAELIKEAVGWQGQFVFDASRPDGAPRKIMDVSRMKDILDWVPKTPIKEGIGRTVEWYIGNM